MQSSVRLVCAVNVDFALAAVDLSEVRIETTTSKFRKNEDYISRGKEKLIILYILYR